jgi:hypothetical protein
MDAKTLTRYLERSNRLHRLLNSRRCPKDIDAQYEALHEEFRELNNTNADVWKRNGQLNSMHDCFVENLTEKKSLGFYKTRFQANASTYDDKGKYQGDTRIEIELASKTPLREISRREVYSMIALPEQKLFGVLYPLDAGMRHVVANCTELRLTLGTDAILAHHQAKQLQQTTVSTSSTRPTRPRM